MGVPKRDVVVVERLLRDQTVVARPTAPWPGSVRDADDAWVLASAVAAHADVLVTGDQDLLTVKEPPLRVLSPRAFWELARSR